jgi:hypothetical protein
MKKLWSNIEYKLSNTQILTKPIISEYINKFFTFITKEIDDNHYLVFIFRITLENGQIKTVTKLQKLNVDNKSKQQIIEYINDKIGLVQNSYFSEPIQSIIISYGIRKGKLEQTSLDLISTQPNLSHHIYYNNNLPITIEPSNYGKIIFQSDDNKTYLIAPKKNTQLLIEIKEGNHHIKYFKNSQLMYEWIDKINTEENSLFRVASLGKTTIY